MSVNVGIILYSSRIFIVERSGISLFLLWFVL